MTCCIVCICIGKCTRIHRICRHTICTWTREEMIDFLYNLSKCLSVVFLSVFLYLHIHAHVTGSIESPSKHYFSHQHPFSAFVIYWGVNSEIFLQNAQRSNKPPSVLNVVTSATPVSVTLKRISVLPVAYVFQNGVTLVFRPLLFGFNVLTTLKKDPANDAIAGDATLQAKHW